ncbi:MAG: DUF5671 domain-containing protein [Acidimicrobiia bacterium]
MTFVALAGVLLLAIVAGLVALGVKAFRGRDQQGHGGGIDLIPYLLLALAVGVAGFSLASLARASLTPDRLAGRPTGAVAGALAGLVVATPVAFLLWRRQARRRRTHPPAPGWPIYLAIIELTFLTAFLFAVGQLAEALNGEGTTADWPDLVVYGGIVVFHWWSERRDPPRADIGDLPRLVGSGVALIALTTGVIGTLTWLLSELYDSLWGPTSVPDPAVPLALTLVAAPIWAWRWLPAWDDDPNAFRNFYLGFVTASALIMAIAAGVTLIATFLAFLFTDVGSSQQQFRLYPTALAFVIAGGAIWLHHRRRLGPGRTGAVRGYEYAMAATGLGTLIGSATGLVDTVFRPNLAGTNTGELLIGLGCLVIASASVWLWFWRKVQAAPRAAEVGALPRRIYLIGMAIVTGLTAAGSLIAALVVVFRSFLGEVGATGDSLRIPVTLATIAGLATWHLFTHIREDGSLLTRTDVKPFTVTVICSHPGNLTSLLPEEARVRVLYRGDSLGNIDDAMAVAIAAEVGVDSSIVWVDESGFRTSPAREP